MNTLIRKQLSPQSSLSFDASIRCGSPRESFNFNICGNDDTVLSFIFTGSRIYDHLNQFIYSYSSGDEISISGNFISGKKFNYVINEFVFPDHQVSISGMQITGLEANSDKNNFSIGTRIFGSYPKYSITYSENVINAQSIVNIKNESDYPFTLNGLSIDSHYSKPSEVSISPIAYSSYPITISGSDSINFAFNFSGSMKDSSTVIPIVLDTDFGLQYEDVSLQIISSWSNSIYLNVLSSGINLYNPNQIDFKLLLFTYAAYSGVSIDILNLNSGLASGTVNGRGLSSRASGQYYSGLNGVEYTSLYCDLYTILPFTGEYPISGGFYFSANMGSGILTGQIQAVMYNDSTFDIL